MVKSQQDKAEAIVTSSTALSADVRSGADVCADVLPTRKGETKPHLSKYPLEASQEAARHRHETNDHEASERDSLDCERKSVENTFINVRILDLIPPNYL